MNVDDLADFLMNDVSMQKGGPDEAAAKLLPLIESDALFAAADDIQALHPGEVKNSVIWLRQRAHMILGGGSEDAQMAAFYEDPANREPAGPLFDRILEEAEPVNLTVHHVKPGWDDDKGKQWQAHPGEAP